MKNEKDHRADHRVDHRVDHRADHRADHKTDHNRGFRSGRTWKTPFLFSVILCFILSACGNSGVSDGNVGESSIAVTAEAGTEQKPGSGTNGNTGVATEATTEEKITPLKLSDKIVCLDEKKKMYDLSALLPDPGEYDLLQDYMLEDTEHVLLLYLNMAEKEGDPFTYTVKRLTLSDGSITSVAEKKELKNYEGDMLPYLSFCGREPLMVFDLSNSAFYPEDGTVFRPETEKDDYFVLSFEADGKQYFADSQGSLHQIVKEQDGYQTKTIWAADDRFWNYLVAGIEDGCAILSAEPKWVSDAGKVFIRVNLTTGTPEEIYTTDDKTDLEDWKARGGFRVSLQAYQDPYRVIRLQEGTVRKELVLDGNDFLSKCSENDSLDFLEGEYPLADGVFMFRAQYATTGMETMEEHLILWDCRYTEGEVRVEPTHTPVEVPEISDEANRKLRKEMQTEFGILIYIGDEIETDFMDYTAEPEKDTLSTMNTLLSLRKAYRNYPKGFLDQLRGEEYPLRIYVVNNILGKGSGTISVAGGLQHPDEGGPQLVFATTNASDMEATIYHETTHSVYEKLTRSGFLEENAEGWMALNPPGFTYASTYEEDQLPDAKWTSEDLETEDYEEVYFIMPYNKTFQTEDVADLMAKLMAGEEPPAYYKSSHLQAKCKYVFEAIRKGFDTKGWPEKTCWEQRLEQAGQ